MFFSFRDKENSALMSVFLLKFEQLSYISHKAVPKDKTFVVSLMTQLSKMRSTLK